MILKLSIAPTTEPVSLEQARRHCRIDDVEENTYLTDLITTARQYVEELCGPLITQTWEQYEDDWPGGEVLRIGKPRLQSVTSVIYTDEDGAAATLAAANYTVAIEDERWPAVVLKPDYDWPTVTLLNTNPIKITLVCGYGATGATVPLPLRQAILLLIGHWYEERQIAAVGHHIAAVPFAVNSLLANYRVR
jgi:uncharacterized phiE125 gp8 family phage protein